MRRITRTVMVGLALAIAGAGPAAFEPAWADPPGGFEKGKGKGKQAAVQGRSSNQGGGVSIEFNFHNNDQLVIRDYYGGLAQRGFCPPGLAKKNNGCMPPGQAKKWAVGQRLPRDVVFYDLPPDLLIRLTPPPQGYRYVRVAADVLMIAAGTGLVAAAIEDLARM